MSKPTKTAGFASTTLITGIILTVLVTIPFGFLMYRKWSTVPDMTLADWGNFVAGWVAALAFIWLVVGYWGQSIELRQSAQALNRQETELRTQVEAIENLANHTLRQAAATEELHRTHSRPVIAFINLGAGGGWRARNVGNGAALNVDISEEADTGEFDNARGVRFPSLPPGDETPLGFLGGRRLVAVYSDLVGNRSITRCQVSTNTVTDGADYPTSPARQSWQLTATELSGAPRGGVNRIGEDA